jgi:PAS domain S-box-containing protein
MRQSIEILIVEDSENDTELLVHQFRRGGFEPRWSRVDTELDYLLKLRPELDIIISDLSMPRFDGMRALELLKIRGYEIPFIIVSGKLGEEQAVEAIKLGATDYLMKDRIERLGSAVKQALEQSRLRRGCEEARKAALEGERKFRALFDAAHDAIYVLHNGVFVDCNAKGLFMYGRTWNQIVGHTPDEFAPPTQPDGRNSREKAIEIVMKGLQGEPQLFEWMVYHSDGTPVYSEVSLNRIEMGGNVYLMAVARDITERRRAEEKIGEQAAVLDKARDAIAIRDLTGKILFWNKSAERLYGWPREEVIDRNISELIYPNTSVFEEANRYVVEHGEWIGEVQHYTKDRRELMVEARWTLLRDKEGAPRSVLAINTDVTEKKAIEAQLMRAQRIESIGTLAGGIAHDLNNILTPILTSIELLKMTMIDSKGRHILDTIEASSRRGAEIVRQVLSFARGVKGKRLEVQPKRLLKDIETLIRDTFPKNIKLHVALPKEGWSIQGDPTQLHQVLLNLSVNARDAMPEGGILEIVAENVVLDQRNVAKYLHARPGRYVKFTVRDSGAGIPAAMIEKIFEPFFTTKEVGKGTGLGLSTVVAIVKSHDGFVDVQSEVGRGTVFNLCLPAAVVTTEKRDHSSPLASFPRGNGETVLVVDDESSILTVTCDTLESFGYQTLAALDGTEAVALYQKHAEAIAVVITDMTMPNMDGPTTIRTLLKINPDLKIIASSGFMTAELANKAFVDSKYFLPKPYAAETLLKIVRAILTEPSDRATETEQAFAVEK